MKRKLEHLKALLKEKADSPHLAQCFDHITSFPFALVFRLRTGQGEANKPAITVSGGGCQSPQSLLLVEASAEVAQLA